MKYLKNKIKSNFLWATIPLFALLIWSSCEGKYNPRSANQAVEKVDSFDRIKVSQDHTDVDKIRGSYTYIIEPEAMVYPVVKADSITSKDSGHLSHTEMPTIDIVVESSKMDVMENRPPLYGETCMEAEYPVKCSSDNVANYIRENLEFPEEAMVDGKSGPEMISFYVSKSGDVEDIKVSSAHSSCEGCRSAAYAVIAAMPNKWTSALEDGKPVRAKITIPIEFKTLD